MDAIGVADFATSLSGSILKALGIESSLGTQVSPSKILSLKEAVSQEGSSVVFMRHGEQSPPEWIFSIPNPSLRKIRMMQDPFNKQDLLTNQGLADAFATGLTLLHVSKATGKNVRVISSENSRAK